MKLALLLPGYLDSPDYLHMKTFENGLHSLGYTTVRIDPCNLWKTNKIEDYSITNYVRQIQEIIDTYKGSDLSEVVLVGHSLGGFVAIIAGGRIKEVTKIVSLCSPADRVKSATKWKGEKFLHSQRELPENTSQFRSFDIPYSFAQDGLQYSAEKEAKKIRKPIMIFIAQNDTTIFPEETEKIVASAYHPYVVRQKDMGHSFRHSQKECDIVWEHIKKFLCETITKKDLEKIMQDIVAESVRLKDKYTSGVDVKVEFGDIFCQEENRYQQLTNTINKMGKVVYATPTGNIYSLKKPIKTVAGELWLVKIRTPDTKLRLRGDADFDTDYSKLKQKYLNHPHFELIVREKFEMLRLSDSTFDVMTCFSNIPVRKWI